MSYTLENDGDSFEKDYWNLFVKIKFPSYEKYWVERIVPLTRRPTSIHFRNSADLLACGYSGEDVCKAQLHYTILRQLVGAYEILVRLKNKGHDFKDSDAVAECLFHIGAAQDVAFEFLQRNRTPNVYDPWTANKRLSPSGATSGSQEACKKWKNDNGHPLTNIREYRNHMTHGRMQPAVLERVEGKLYLPKIGFELKYLDWRRITDPPAMPSAPPDYESVDNILSRAFDETLKYFEQEWKKL